MKFVLDLGAFFFRCVLESHVEFFWLRMLFILSISPQSLRNDKQWLGKISNHSLAAVSVRKTA
jgi:hypothetical protein